MIRVICRCGGVAKVEEGLTGRRIPCPRCGSPIIVPGRPAPAAGPAGPETAPADTLDVKAAPPDKPPAPPEKPARRKRAHKAPVRPERALDALAASRGKARPAAAMPAPAPGANAKAVLLGAAMLATIFIPWDLRGGKLFMSWHVLQQAAAGVILLLVALWVVGLAAVIAGAMLDGLALAASCLGLSVIGLAVVLMSGESMGRLTPWLSAAGPIFVKGVFGMAAFLLMGQMAATRLHLRAGGTLPVRLAEGLLGVGMAGLAAAGLIVLVADYAGLWLVGRQKVFYDFLSLLVIWVCLLAAGPLAVMHAVAPLGRSSRGRGALLLCGLAVLAAIGYVAARPAAGGGDLRRALPAVNVCLLVACPWWLGRAALADAAACLVRRFGRR